MQAWVLWHGGSNYSPPERGELEEFRSLCEAGEEFRRRAVSNSPAEIGGPSMHVYLRDPREEWETGDAYPDRIIKFGPHGGLRITPAPERRDPDMTKEQLYQALVDLCQQHGTTTQATYDALHNAVNSIQDEPGDDADGTTPATYKIVRKYARDFDDEILVTGLTLAEARAHCGDPESSSMTASTPSTPEARTLARVKGLWFDVFYDASQEED